MDDSAYADDTFDSPVVTSRLDQTEPRPFSTQPEAETASAALPERVQDPQPDVDLVTAQARASPVANTVTSASVDRVDTAVSSNSVSASHRSKQNSPVPVALSTDAADQPTALSVTTPAQQFTGSLSAVSPRAMARASSNGSGSGGSPRTDRSSGKGLTPIKDNLVEFE